MCHRRLLVAAVALLFINPALAQETTPGDACTASETNYIKQVGGPETSGIVHLMRCDGASWQQYMTFLANRNVGIGTLNPSGLFQVQRAFTPLSDPVDSVVLISSPSMDNLGPAADPILLHIKTNYGLAPKGRLLEVENRDYRFTLQNSNRGMVRVHRGDFAHPVVRSGSIANALLGLSYSGNVFDGDTPVIGAGVNLNITSWSGATSSYRDIYGVPVKVSGAAPGVGGIFYGFYSDVSGGDSNFAFYGAAGRSYFADDVGIGTSSPEGILDVSSTTSGMLPPRMTTIQRNAIVTPVAGMFIYNTDTNKNEYYNGTTWASLSSGSSVLTAISDADGDTKVQVEEAPNENVIRFDAGTAENVFKLDAGGATIQFLSGSANPNGLAIVNLAGSLGSGAGITMRTASTVQAARLGSTRESGPNDSGLKFETADNGVLNEHMRIDSNGNVGIRTNAPATRLHVVGEVRGSLFSLNTGERIKNLAENAEVYFLNNAISLRTGALNAVYVDSSQNVGIKSSAPAATLLTSMVLRDWRQIPQHRRPAQQV